MAAAAETRVPAGAALAVDREKFAALITQHIENEPRIRLIREEVTTIRDDQITIIATGPLSSDALTAEIMKLTGSDQMYFYDAIAPIVAADSIDTSIAFRAARYDKGGDDYLNCPFDAEQYARFYAELLEGKGVPLQRFEETRWFEACLPIEEMARRGVDTLRFGPMKPVGLRAVAAGKFNGRRIQPRGLPESSTLRRTSASVATHPRIAERGVSSVWPNPSQHVHLFTARAPGNHADAGAS
jgi:methylenetetrahydrofolate--tRNA-(uracil-5-)-methyltransferase